jgi:hypothetical protein
MALAIRGEAGDRPSTGQWWSGGRMQGAVGTREDAELLLIPTLFRGQLLNAPDHQTHPMNEITNV